MSFSWNPFAKEQAKIQQLQQQHANEQSQVDERVSHKNANYSIFNGINSDIERIVSAKSVITKNIAQQTPIANPTWQTVLDSDVLAMPIATNKVERINQYRTIANLTECQWCLDEICDEFIHEDEHGNFINLNLPERLNKYQKKVLQEEFKKYIDLFKLRDDGYNIIKRFLIEGELAWENVIKHDHPEMGIIGVRFLPTEYYETLMDVKTNLPVGLIFDTERFAKDRQQLFSANYVGAAQTFNAIVPVTASFTFNRDTCVPMLWSQLTYINSGEYSTDGLVTYPLIEKSKQAYYQLALLQDAAVILRVTRAPERLLINVNTGGMTQNYADEYVRNFANSLKSKKVTMPGKNGDIAQVYNPVSMLESYIFGKSDKSEGTSIESVGSNANYDELGDIEYFLRRFMKQFKVPFSRYKTPENAPEKDESISYEEYSFSRMIMRFQRRFADGFKRGFITHLKLRDIWEKEGYELLESDIQITFVKPVLYDLYEMQKTVETKMNIYKSVVDNEEFSKILAMKKFLGFSDDDVKENFKNLIMEKELTGLADYFADQIAEKKGLAGWETPIPFADDAKAEQKKEAAGGEDAESEGDEDSSEEGEDAGSEDSGEEKKEEPEEAPAPTFGLGD